MHCLENARERIGTCVLALCAALSLGALAASADEVAGEITASIGDVQQGAVNEGEPIELGKDGACSILVDQDVVLEVCGDTSVALQRDPKSNRRVIALDRGEIKVVVEPRQMAERIEIHTAAAIATLLGTVVYVSIDPETQATTITSAESRVSVRSGNPRVQGKTMLNPAHQVTVRPGSAPPAVAKHLNREQIAQLGGCLVDFRKAALNRDSFDQGHRVAARLATKDISGNQGGGQFPSPPAKFDPNAPPPDSGNTLVGKDGLCAMPGCGNQPPASIRNLKSN